MANSLIRWNIFCSGKEIYNFISTNNLFVALHDLKKYICFFSESIATDKKIKITYSLQDELKNHEKVFFDIIHMPNGEILIWDQIRNEP